jgi:WD40-like Beta Propeller Repeat
MRTTLSIALVGISMLCSAAALAGHSRDPEWGPGKLVVTGGGCPIETPDGQSLLFASGRAGTLDIWVLDRPSLDADWSAPKRLAEPVNSDTAADFCPAPKGRTLFFVSDRPHPEACGNGTPNGDIYVTRQSPAGEWSEPEHLPCAPYGPNTAGTERSPSLVRTWYGTFLFFSTLGDGGDDDIYVSRMNWKGEFEQGHVVAALSTQGFQDRRARRAHRCRATASVSTTGAATST